MTTKRAIEYGALVIASPWNPTNVCVQGTSETECFLLSLQGRHCRDQ